MTHGVMYGITHDRETKAPIIREARVLKVGIGIPKGRAISIYIYKGKWLIRYGSWSADKKLTMKTVAQVATRAEAEAFHAAHFKEAAVSNRPQKLPFFTFTKRSIMEESGKPVEVFEPDFGAIEAHGETPREIDIVLMSEKPYQGEYQMWSTSDLKCHGDGVSADRSVGMIPSKDSPLFSVWEGAKQAGLKYYACQPCWLDGCNYAQDGGGCKPGVTLNFQLANNMRLGATAYFHTTSFRSSSQIFSAIESMRQSAGRVGSSIIGLPLKMVLSPFRTNHNGQAATQYGVSLELRAEDMKALRARFEESAWVPRSLQSRQVEEIEMVPQLAAPAIAAEFYPDAVDITPDFEEEGAEDGAEVGAGAGSATAATATQATTEALSGKLEQQRTRRAKAETGPEPPILATRTETATPEATPAAPVSAPASAPPAPPAILPGTQRPPMPSTATKNEWPERTRKAFHAALGDLQYISVLQATIKSSDDGMVNASNHKEVWAMMQTFKDAKEMLAKQQSDQDRTPAQIAEDVAREAGDNASDGGFRLVP